MNNSRKCAVLTAAAEYLEQHACRVAFTQHPNRDSLEERAEAQANVEAQASEFERLAAAVSRGDVVICRDIDPIRDKLRDAEISLPKNILS